MNMYLPKCDLHLHTVVSDGDFSIEYVLKRQKDMGLDVVSVTDHDTVDGVEEAVQRGAELGLQVVPGVELSTMDDREVHILGYNVDYKNPDFNAELKRLRELREKRNYMILEKLSSFGINIPMKDVKLFSGKVTGRSHIAKAMAQKGVCQSINQAFDEYLAFGKKAYVKETRISPEDGVKLILNYGGTPVLAHPYSLQLDTEDARAFVKKLVQAGLRGIESEYFSHTNEDKEKYGGIADEFDLLKTGGSDFHREQAEDLRPKFCYLSTRCMKELRIEF